MLAMFQYYGTPYGTAQQVFGFIPVDERAFGTFLSRNQFAALMELAAPIALWYTIRRNAVAGGLCYAMILAATITAASRAGAILVFAEMVFFGCFVLFGRRREGKVIVSILAGLALLLALGAAI